MNRIGFIVSSALVLLALLASMLFVVDQRQFGVVYALGEIKDVITEPGLNFKLPPPFQNVTYIQRLDTVGGLACMYNNPGVDQVTIALTVNFLKPLKKEPFRAIGRELRSGKTTAVAEGEMRDGDNELCAVALGTWYKILRRREEK